MIKIIYASVTGNTERVARYIAEKLIEKVAIEVISADEVDVSVFNKEDVFVIATSTWNLGQMNQYLEELYSQLATADLSGVKMAFVGLGDTVYGEENFCRSMLNFRERALEVGGSEICELIKIDGDPDNMAEIGVDDWVQMLLEKIV